MKKLFAGISATVLGLACLTSCNIIQAEYDVKAAAEWLDGVYVDQIVEGRSDYNVLNTIAYNGNAYNVEWSVETTNNAVVLVKGETETKVDVDEAALVETDYTLIATVSDPNGNKAEVKFYAAVQKAPSVVPTPIKAAPAEGTAYKLYAYNNDSKIDLYFNGKIASKFYLGSVEAFDDENSVDVYVEYVEGSDKLFNLYFMSGNDKQYVGIKENWNSTKGYWAYNPYIENAPVSQFEYSEEYKTIITTVDACSVDKEDAKQDTTKTIFWGNSGNHYTTIGGIEIEDFGKESIYTASLCTLESIAGVSAADKMAFEKDGLLFEETFTGNGTIDVSLIGKRFPDVKIAWAVEGENLSYTEGKVTITAPTAETTAKVTATLTLGELTETKEFTITLKPAIVLPEANSTLTIPEANALGNQFEKDTYSENKYYVSGTVKSVTSTTYGNLYIEDENGNEFYVYGLYDAEGVNRYDAMTTQPTKGDKITVYGKIGKYSSAQMKNGWMTAYEKGEYVAPEVTIPDADTELTVAQAIAIGESKDHNTYTEGKYYVSGEITEIYNTQYGNMKITDGTNILTIYGTYDADGSNRFDAMNNQPEVGDTIKVYGIIGQYNGTAQVKNGWIVAINGEALLPDEGGEGEEGGDEPTVQDPAADSVLTIEQAIALGASKEHNVYTAGKYYVTGEITEIYNTQYGNMKITDGTNILTVYGTYDADGTNRFDAMTNQPAVGDTIKVYGIIGQYNGTPQVKNGWIVEITPAGGNEGGEGEEGGDEPTVQDPAADSVLTIEQAIALGASKEHNVYTAGKYYVTGEITEIYNTQYGNMKITDGTNILTVYGTYDADGTNRFDAMTNQPAVGDTIKVYGIIGQYNGTPQVKNGWIVEITPAGGNEGGEGEEGGDEGETEIQSLTIGAAVTLGAGKAHNTYTEEKYYVTGKIVEIQNATYGNLVISDGTDSILVYGLYIDVEDSEDDIRYDAMETKPLVGDTIKVLSVVGQFSNKAQLKNAFLVELTAATPTEKVALEKAALTLPESNVGEASIALIENGNVCPDVTIAWNVTAGGDIATITDGKLTIVNPNAETTVTVVATLTLDGADSESKTFNIVVTPAAGQTWKMVTDVSQLKAGSKIVIAALGYNYAIGDTQNSNNRAQSAITKSGTTITFDEANVEVLTLGAGTTAGTFSFQVEEGGYLYAASSSKNYLRTETTLSANSSFTISIAADGTATVVAQGTNTRNTMQYNQSSSLFACYSSASQKAICIYIYA